MSLIDVKSLLSEVSDEAPCGDDLEYDPEFGELERVVQGKPEQQIGDTLIPAQDADWPDIVNKAVNLFARTKDLRVTIYLIRALIHTEGMTGLSDGLAVIQGLLENSWDTVHPQLDPADDNDPTLRINILASLCDPDAVLHSVRETILVKSVVLGQFSLRDILITTGKLSLPAGSSEEPIDISTINGAFMEADLEDLRSTSNAIHQSIESLISIESFLMEKVGAMQVTDLSALPELLQEAQQIMSEYLSQRGVTNTAVPTEGTEATQSSQNVSQPMTGAINSREDVIRGLDKMCEYFKQHEPSSPVPMLLQRAKRLVAKDFIEILRDLTPAGVTQAEEIIGISNKNQQ